MRTRIYNKLPGQQVLNGLEPKNRSAVVQNNPNNGEIPGGHTARVGPAKTVPSRGAAATAQGRTPPAQQADEDLTAACSQ